MLRLQLPVFNKQVIFAPKFIFVHHPFLQQVIQVMKNVQHLPLVKPCVVVDPAPYFWM